MWICPRCNFENAEDAATCENCGSARSAGRFGSNPQQRRMPQTGAPRVAAAPAMRDPRDTRDPRYMRDPRDPRDLRDQDTVQMPRSATRSDYPAPDMDPPRPKRRRRPAAALARFVGAVLTVLLPLLTALLAWKQYDALCPALTGLLLPEGAADGLRIGCYAVFALAAVLLSFLPGLWTLLAARPVAQKR